MAAKYQRGNLGAGLSTTFGMLTGDLFHVQAYFWQARSQNALKERFGRETSGSLSFRFMRPGGYITVRGDIPATKAVEPDSWVGQISNIVYTEAASKTITFSVVVESFEFDNSQPDSELKSFTATCKLTAKPTYSGYGSATAGGSVTKSDVTLYGGDIVIDPAAVVLAGEATVIIDWWTLSADTDAATVTRLTDAMTAATAPNSLKKRPSSINQDAPDGGIITLRFGLNDTNDDVLNPHTTRFVDPNGLERTEETTAINGTPDDPTQNALVLRGTRDIKHNDGATQSVAMWAERTTVQDITFPGSPTSSDKLGSSGSTIAIRPQKVSTQVTGSASEPSFTPGGAYKKREWSFTQHTDAGKYIHRIEAGLTTVQEEEENSNSILNIDPSGIGTFEVHGRIVVTATTVDPDAGTVTAGLSLASTATKEVHDNAFMRVFTYKTLTNEESIEHHGSSATASNTMPQLTTVGITNIDTEVITVASTMTPGAIAYDQQSTYINTSGYDRLAATKINKTLAQVRITKINDDLIIYEAAQTARLEHTRTNATPTLAGTSAAVVIVDSVQLATGVYKKMLGEFGQYVVYGSITVRRRKTGISNLTDTQFLTTRGSVNADVFLNYPVATVMFTGVTQRTSWKSVIEGVAHTQVYDLHYLYRSIGFHDEGQIQIGRWFLSTSTHTIGATPALSLVKGWSVGNAPSATFAPFLV